MPGLFQRDDERVGQAGRNHGGNQIRAEGQEAAESLKRPSELCERVDCGRVVRLVGGSAPVERDLRKLCEGQGQVGFQDTWKCDHQCF